MIDKEYITPDIPKDGYPIQKNSFYDLYNSKIEPIVSCRALAYYCSTLYDDKEIKDLCISFSKSLQKEISPYLKKINYSDELHLLSTSCDNKPHNRKIFFDDIFLNRKISFFNGKYEICGIFLSRNRPFTDRTNFNPEIDNFVVYLIIEHLGNWDEQGESIQIHPVISSLNNWGVTLMGDVKNENEYKKIIDDTLNYVSNIIDFVNNQKHEYKLVENTQSKEQDEKRIKRGKDPIHTTVYIRLNEPLLKYCQELQHNERKYSHKFLVRGHWMHLNGNRYKNGKGKTVWRRPFFKGEGIYINKDVKILGVEPK